MLSERQARWIKNTCIVIILVTVFSGFADKHPSLGMCIAGGAGVVLIYVMWKYLPESESEESDRENEHYLTIRELIDRLEEIEDDTSVVVDSNGNPITRLYREERTICQQQKKS